MCNIKKNSFYDYHKKKKNKKSCFLNILPDENIELFQRYFPNCIFIYEQNESIILMEKQLDCQLVLRSGLLTTCHMNGWVTSYL